MSVAFRSALKIIADVTIRKKVLSGKTLWSMGDPAEFFAILISGAIEINRISVNGTETCLGLFGPGNSIGVPALVKNDQYPATARAVAKDTEVLKIYLRAVLQDKRHPCFAEISVWVKELLLSHDHILRDKIDLLSAGRVERRVVELFRQLINRFGIKKGRITYTIPIRISKTQISKLIEVRVETVIRLLSSWSKEGLIRFEKNAIQVLDYSRLEKLSEAEL